MLQAQHPLAQGLVHGARACLPNLNNLISRLISLYLFDHAL